MIDDQLADACDAATAPFRVLEKRVYQGPNLYSRRPMIRIRVDLGKLENWPTNRLPAFTETLVSLLPGLAHHGCSCRTSGGFPSRLQEGTWLGHVIEHVALELQTAAGSPVSRGKTRSVSGQPGVYDILFRYRDDALALAAGGAAVRLVLALLPADLAAWRGEDSLPLPLVDDPKDVPALVRALSEVLARNALGPTTNALVEEARRRGIPALRLDKQSFVQLGYGSRQHRLRASITDKTSQVAVTIAGNKDLTKTMLLDLGLPAPRGTVVRTVDEALMFARALDHPIVIKPLDGNHGRGVSTDLVTDNQIRTAFAAAAAISARVIVEQHLPGDDHRILVVAGKVVAVARRAPASVTGDGFHSVAQLIDLLNEDPKRGDGHEKVLTKISLDASLYDMLERQGKHLATVPQADETVLLRGTANLSSGGTSTDCTDDIHPQNRLIAELAARTIGLDIAGVDFVCPDIRRPVAETGGGIVEINAAPGFRMHLAPSYGQARDVAAPVIDMLFPRDARSRIPIVAVTGTNGKSTTARMISAILREDGNRVGMTNTSGVYVDDLLLKAGDASGPRSAGMVLRNPAVDVAVLETARGGILREGLGFDTCSVGVVLNVSEDHLGLKGVDTLEDLAAIKAVVVSSVARTGSTVLNFDDCLTRAMARKARSMVIWFSLIATPDNPAMAAHLEAGGLAVLRATVEGRDHIILYRGCHGVPIVATADIPATAGGAASFNIANALAAVAAGAALGVDVEIIARALGAFASSFADNPGRFNIIDDHPFRVVLDYAHNPASLKALGESLPQLKPGSGRILGMVSIPGDRRDRDILEIGRIAAGAFDHIIFREGPDGRGRPRGEVLRLLETGARAAPSGSASFESVLEEHDAVDHCLSIARAGDLLVLFPTRVDDVYRQVRDYIPASADHYVSA
jgi:cyanophycin synthetase